MAEVSKVSTISKVFTQLGNNSDSLVPMYVKDIASGSLTSYTYFKEGGNRDGIEKTFEEFATGIVWLGGIPFLKKIFDKTVYKKAGLSPDVDAKRLFNGFSKESVDSVEFARDKALSLGDKFKEQADILADTVKNKTKAKNLALSKFGIATAPTGLGLYGIITFKQKQTEKAIEKQVREKLAKESVLKNTLNNNEVYQTFKGTNKGSEPSFKGLGTFIMSNPIANTSLVDCVISGTRLAQAREGERFEVGLKEASEVAFIYGLAQPLQKTMEFFGKKFFNKPINLDYSVLDSNTIKEAIEAEKQTGGSSKLMQDAKALVEIMGEQTGGQKTGMVEKLKTLVKGEKFNKEANATAKKAIDFVFDNQDSPLIDVFKKSGNLSVFKTKEGVEQISLLSSIDANKLKATAKNTMEIVENAAKSGDINKYLKQTKILKGAAIVANIGISAVMMGYLQPKLNLFLRKKFNNGDNTNPAIAELTKQYEQKLAFEGSENKKS